MCYTQQYIREQGLIMKDGIIKIWVCQECEKEYLDRPIMCTSCNKFEFYVKYGGQITDEEALTKLVGSYKEEEPEKKRRIRM